MEEDLLYETIKARAFTIYPLGEVKKKQIKLIRIMLDNTNNGVNEDNVNSLLKKVLQVPELIASHPRFRQIVILRVNEIINHEAFKGVIFNDIYRASNEYFEWLKLRSDYEEDPEVIMKRVKARISMIQPELIEKLYHPDRYERMVESYGEVWADIHFA